jgi:inosose dehydratase
MPVSRRDFLIRLAASGAVISLPAIHQAEAGVLYPPMDLSYFRFPIHHGAVDIRIGYASITWSGHDKQAIEDISALGYPGIQLRSNIVSDFPDPHALRDLLAEHHLKFVALSSGSASIDRTARQSIIETHVKNARYLHEAGGLYLQLVGASSKEETSFSADDLKYEGQLLTEIAKRVADHGLQTGFHNHMHTIGQTPEQVDAILDAADANYVKLELDTAHYLQGGGDPAAAIRKYDKRVLFLHLKDVKESSTKDGYQFTELGEGRVNFPAVFEALHAIHFRGWGIIELDGERPGIDRTPKESAELSKTYLEQKLDVHA